MLPQLLRHLASSNYVCYTYAATTIERILFIKRGSQLLFVVLFLSSYASASNVLTDRFTQEDVQGIASEILNTILTKIEASGTPEKIAENDYLMKCEWSLNFCARLDIERTSNAGIMRIILTARQSLVPTNEKLFQRLLAILGAICKNPSNPNFDQYLFESISALIR